MIQKLSLIFSPYNNTTVVTYILPIQRYNNCHLYSPHATIQQLSLTFSPYNDTTIVTYILPIQRYNNCHLYSPHTMIQQLSLIFSPYNDKPIVTYIPPHTTKQFTVTDIYTWQLHSPTQHHHSPSSAIWFPFKVPNRLQCLVLLHSALHSIHTYSHLVVLYNSPAIVKRPCLDGCIVARPFCSDVLATEFPAVACSISGWPYWPCSTSHFWHLEFWGGS